MPNYLPIHEFDQVIVTYMFPEGERRQYVGQVRHTPSDTGDMWLIMITDEVGEPTYDEPRMTAINPSCAWLVSIARLGGNDERDRA